MVNAARVRAAQNRQNANLRTIEVLQEQNLKLDGVFDGVAVVFHGDRSTTFIRKPVYQIHLGNSLAQRGHERLARQPELLRLAIVRRSKNDENAFGMIGRQLVICVAIGFPSAERTHMRSGNAYQAIGCRRQRMRSHINVELAACFAGLIGIRRAGMTSLAPVRLSELLHRCIAQRQKSIVDQKAGLAQRLHQVLLQFAHLNFAGGLHKALPQVKLRLLTIEAREAGHQGRGNQQHRITEVVGIANEQPRPLGIG